MDGRKKGVIKRGQTVVFTSGVYDSYRLETVVEALRDFDYIEEAEKHRKLAQMFDEYCSYEDFVHYLIKIGAVKEVPYKEINLGWYDFLDEKE